VTGLYAARVAARLRRELNADVDMIPGRYGVFKVVVDGDTVVDGGGAAFLGVMPSPNEDHRGGEAAGGAAMWRRNSDRLSVVRSLRSRWSRWGPAAWRVNASACVSRFQ
jgi:hypothetical protein